MELRSTLSLSPSEEEEIIELILSLPPSLACAQDAARVISERRSMDPEAAHQLLEHWLDQKRIEARTALPGESVNRQSEQPNENSNPPYRWFRTSQGKITQ